MRRVKIFATHTFAINIFTSEYCKDIALETQCDAHGFLI